MERSLKTESTMNSSQPLVSSMSLADAIQPVLKDVQAIKQALPELIPTSTAAARRIVDHVTKKPGKCVRPALYLMTCNLVDYDGPHKIPMGAVCEYVHTASLLHDDVIDNSPLRRGYPAAHSIWGDEETILVGDLMYSTASELMADTNHIEIVKHYAAAIRHMSEAELLQLQNLFNPNMAVEDYYHILQGKTGALMKAACASAAFLGQSEPELCTALGEFGMNLGVAFQLIDDALDYQGTEDLFGKPTLADLKEGKVTLPIILLLEILNGDDKKQLEAMISNKNISQEEIQWVATQVQTHGTASSTLQRAAEHTRTALQQLDLFPQSNARDHLKALAQSLVHRTS